MKTSLKAALFAAFLGVGLMSTPALAHDNGYGGGDRGYNSRDDGEHGSYGDRGDHRRFMRHHDRHDCGDRHHRRHGGDDRRYRERSDRDDSYGHGHRSWR